MSKKSVENVCEFLKNYKLEKEKKFCEICNVFKEFKKKKDEMRLRGFNDFNYIELLKGIDDENTHSKIIAEFLNPNGSHYQGTVFIENFFEVLDLKYNLQNWNVITEKFIRNYFNKGQGRIDVFLTDGKRYIILENKTKANDQPSQIYKYVEGLYKEKENIEADKILVLYLTKDAVKPSKVSLYNYEIKNGYLELNNQKRAKIKCIGYEDILIWMEKNLSTVENISNLRESIKQYIKTLKKLLHKEENVMNLKEYLLKNENRDILITLIENKKEFDEYIGNDEVCKKIVQEENLDSVLEEVLLELRKKISFKIEELIHKEFKDYHIDDIGFVNGEKYGYISLLKENWYDKEGNPMLMYALEFEKWGNRGLYYGISKYDENIPYKNTDIPSQLKNVLFNGFKTSKWWLAWKYFEWPYNLDRYDFWQNEDAKKLYLEILNSDLDDFVKKHYIEPLKAYVSETEDIIEKYLNSINKNSE